MRSEKGHAHSPGTGAIPCQDFLAERLRVIVDGWQPERPSDPARCVHMHPHYEVLFITRGERALWAGGRESVAPAGSLIVLPPFTPHCEYLGTKSISYFVLRFAADEPASATRATATPAIAAPLKTSRAEFVLPVPNPAEFLALFKRMLREHQSADEGRDLLLGAYLVEFIVLLGRATRAAQAGSRQTRSGYARVADAMSAMEDGFGTRLDLPALAQQAFVSPSHFSHTFKRVAGVSPHRYQIRARIREAQRLLLETDEPASAIADRLGYATPFFFYRQFKAKVGHTAGDYRRLFRASPPTHTTSAS